MGAGSSASGSEAPTAGEPEFEGVEGAPRLPGLDDEDGDPWADLAALEMETRPDHLGPATTDFELTLSDEDGPGTVRAHRAILVARSAYLRELVLATVHRDGMALRYASQELKADHEVALAAVKQDVGAIKWLRKSDRKVVLAAMKKDNVPSPSP